MCIRVHALDRSLDVLEVNKKVLVKDLNSN